VIPGAKIHICVDPDQLEQALINLIKTLFVGRMHLTRRLSCVAQNQNDLIHLLERWIETGTASQIYTSEAQAGKVREQASLKKFGNHCIQECGNGVTAAGYLENLTTIAELYVEGYSLDFHALFPRESRRIPLPPTPLLMTVTGSTASGLRCRLQRSKRKSPTAFPRNKMLGGLSLPIFQWRLGESWS